MYLLHIEKIENKKYPPLQRVYDLSPRPGTLIFPEKFYSVFHPSDKRAAGFVTIEHDGTTVTSCAWDEEAYQAWCDENPEQPEPEPELTDTEVLNTLLGVSE